ncbi:heat shock protein 70 family, partial [Gigaspora rosea]
NQDLFRSTMEPVEKVLRDSKIDKSQVHEIVLVGGSTRIPKIQKMVSEFFNGKEPNKSINPDEAVAYGAAVQAAIFSGETSGKTQDVLVHDVIPISLGIETLGGVMTPLIRRNSIVPTRRSEVFSTSEIFSTSSDNQSGVVIKVYEGERARAKDNNLLGKFELTNIPPAARDEPRIEVTFDIDIHSIINVSVVDKTTGQSNRIHVAFDNGRLSKEEIERIVADAEKYRAEDEKVAQRIQTRNGLESYVYNLRNTLQCNKIIYLCIKIKCIYLQELENVIQEAITWLENNQEAEKEEYEYKQESLKKTANPIMIKLNSNLSIIEEVD